ncbi:hypothetical protein Kpol_1063p20 [Vanderwaltozyma polyspora DSM 70294]|uniref:Structural maintenance of chromosomes protein n=1 Tax=Vanderwaltozyma polyspora (strain ATCC 22028 / DSM 70294 / BCRC 21397 / CBS 2163 / NBRC 10782 / NRRL Y-8283 / UCD 57-17) TaxID=436907 RepID=A7TQR4_VANPO|nr:uncharacterized protein Kpol_1063p20 [Vanderwaltozyma polyspora DSM 70294]EDO15409.1 hypothetical protein Kpol_1063p20 [Vanderwaltozyma polyspora DSM 70294]
MKVEELIIDGFKSYATRTVISDWDPQFNAITGLNGSGKSNILDAICFVLGISSMATVRASNLQDLIYKRGQAGVTKASVTIVFDNSDKSNAPIGFESSPTISVTRQVALGGTSKYLINGHRAPQQSVLHLFQSVQLNINNPNFLIMQGKITKVLNMKPTEILSLIEEAAGTKMFEDRREKAERTMGKKEAKLQENRTLLNEEIEPKLEKLRSEKRIFLEFQETQKDLEETHRVVSAFDYNYLVQKQTSVVETLQTSENRIIELKELITKVTDELGSLNEDLEQIQVQKKNELDKNGKLAKLESNESKLMNEISRLKTSYKISEDNLSDTLSKLKSKGKNLEANKQELSNKSKMFEKIEEEYKGINIQLDEYKQTYKKKEELLSTLSTGISSTGGTDGGYSAQLNNAKTKLNEANVSIKKSNIKIEALQRELASNEPKMESAKKDLEISLKQIKQYEEQCSQIQLKIKEHGYDAETVKELKQKKIAIEQQLNKIERENEYLKRKVANIDFTYTKPTGDFQEQSVKGVAARLFHLNENNYSSATALQVCAGGRLYNVVVDNEKTASQLLQRGRLRKRVTIIPLNKIMARKLNDKTLNIAKEISPGNVELALNLIGYEEDVAKAMEFIFGSSLICKDAETAKKVTFHPQVRTRSITLQGDVYDPEGTLSGGSRNMNSSLLVDIQKYNEASKQTYVLQEELSVIQERLVALERVYEGTRVLQNEYNLLKHKLRLAQRNLDSNSSTQVMKRNEEIYQELAVCNNEITTNNELVLKFGNEIKQIERDMKEFSKDKGSKLKELKNELESLGKQIENQEVIAESKSDLFQNLQLETEQLSNEIQADEHYIEQTSVSKKSLEEELETISTQLKEIENELQLVQDQLSEEKKRLLDIDEEAADLANIIKSKSEIKSNSELELQKLTHDLTKFKNSTSGINEKIKQLADENEWLSDETFVAGIIKQNKGIDIESYRERNEQLLGRFNDMKRKVNPNIMAMIENVEKKETALKTMIKTIERDKVKIQETIEKLNEYKRDTLIKTWTKVNEDFGNIFADLLPNSFAKLVPSEGKDVTEGLEVKVKLGSIWKESLVELSGGQRSLIALSLIMALLQFRPAPMYILDEVDAALDLSHTQNIGHLIKTRFKGSQFIVVSLKEGMFTNANRVFRTRFQDGTSVVSVMQ